ncbi:MAG: DUF2786 domain-containing protein [Pikeienuella sp.]
MKDKVASLLRKASDNASSEAEAQTCMTMAMNLMAKFGLSMDEVSGSGAEPISKSNTAWHSGRSGDAMRYVQSAIAAFTSTRVTYRGGASSGTSSTYHGYEAERQLAIWLHGHIANSIKVESRLFNPSARTSRMRAEMRRSFALCMAERIAERLYDMAKTIDDAGRGSGAEVMVVKNARLDEYLDGLDIPYARRRRRTVYTGGAVAGRAAGEATSLHRPVTERDGPLRITA